jgi:hypothetical protein
VEERAQRGIPEGVAERRKMFQNEEERKKFVFEPGRVYSADFGNPYLVFNGWFTLVIMVCRYGLGWWAGWLTMG